MQQSTAELEELDDHKHGHLPFVTLLIYYLRQWKSEHNGCHPSNTRDKELFRRFLRSAARQSPSGVLEENFEEALSLLRRAISTPHLPSALQDIFVLVTSDDVGFVSYFACAMLTEATGPDFVQ